MRYSMPLMLLSFTVLINAQTLTWKKDHIYAGADGKELAIVTPPTLDTTAPTAPTGVTASALSSSAIQINWGASTDTGSSSLAGYKIYRQLGSGASIPVGTVGPGTTQFTDNLLNGGTQYTYRVIGFDNAQNHSAASTAVNVYTYSSPPTDPANLTYSVTYATKVHLSWQSGADQSGTGLAGYRVYRGGTLISGSTPITTLSFDDFGLLFRTSYNYVVKTVDNTGNSSTGAPLTANTTAFTDSFSVNNSGLTTPWTVTNGTLQATSGYARAGASGGLAVYTESQSGALNMSVTINPYTSGALNPAGLIIGRQWNASTSKYVAYVLYAIGNYDGDGNYQGMGYNLRDCSDLSWSLIYVGPSCTSLGHVNLGIDPNAGLLQVYTNPQNGSINVYWNGSGIFGATGSGSRLTGQFGMYTSDGGWGLTNFTLDRQ